MQRHEVKSASRTFEVLELFMEKRRPLRLNEIFTALGYPQSSATYLLKSMVMLGYLNYNRSTMTYLPTMRVTALGNWLQGFLYNNNSLQTLVETIQRRTDETAVLVSQNDLFTQYINIKVPSHEFKVPPSEGAMRLMIDSAGGLAMMSRMRDRAIDKLYRYTKHYELGGSYYATFDDLMREIRWVRHTGFAYVPQRPTRDVASIAFPLNEDLFGIPLAIGVGGLFERISRAQVEIREAIEAAIAEMQPPHEKVPNLHPALMEQAAG